jgi:predicted acylesterase/phospholipase RssA
MAKKLGLVLEGGGGKGAYQLGVLRAFAARDLSFDCIAGTSVGGLNAALWAADKLAEGENLWFNISQDKIYPWRRPRWLAHLLMWLLVPLNVTVNYVRGSMSLPRGRKSKITVRIVLGLLIALMVLAGVYANGMLSLLSIGIAMVLLPAFVFYNEQGAVGGMIGAYVGIPVFFLSMVVLLKISESISDSDTRSLVILVCLIFVSVVTPFLTTFAFDVLKWIGKHLLSQSFLNSLPLRVEVERIMRDVAFQIPIYVAATEPRKLIDPDDRYSVPSPFEFAKMIASGRFGLHVPLVAFVPTRFVPTYLMLSDFHGEELVDALMATAALPIGIVQSVKIRDQEFVDGGIADNRPLFPLITREKCDVIIVVGLGALSEETRQGEQRRWQALYRLIDLSGLDQERLATASDLEKNEPPTHVPYRSVSRWPLVLYIVPKSSLGGFIDGTMNFTAAYARKLMKQGYEDGITFLDAHAEILKTSSAS